MHKFCFRIGACGFAVAIVLFGVAMHWGRTGEVNRLLAVLWPTSILLAPGPGPSTPATTDEFLKMFFSAVMNGSLYFGLSWIGWWAARYLKILKAAPSESERFVSSFILMGLIIVVLVGVVELFLKGPPSASRQGATNVWLVTSNLFALMVITCVFSGWSMWWMRNYYRRRQSAHSSSPPRRARKS